MTDRHKIPIFSSQTMVCLIVIWKRKPSLSSSLYKKPKKGKWNTTTNPRITLRALRTKDDALTQANTRKRRPSSSDLSWLTINKLLTTYSDILLSFVYLTVNTRRSWITSHFQVIWKTLKESMLYKYILGSSLDNECWCLFSKCCALIYIQMFTNWSKLMS